MVGTYNTNKNKLLKLKYNTILAKTIVDTNPKIQNPQSLSMPGALKGLYTDLRWGVLHIPVSSSGIQFTSRHFQVFDPCRRYDRFYGVTDWSNRSVKLLLVEHFGPILDTIKPTIVATGIKENDKA